MTTEEFKTLRNFSIDEKDYLGYSITQNLTLLKLSFMKKLDTAISFAKEYALAKYGEKARGGFIVHALAYGKHTEGSYHYKGQAVDGHFVGLDLFETVMIFIKSGFHGIGLYPEWKMPGVHVDDRMQEHISTWYAYYKRDSRGDYVLDNDGFKIQVYNYDYGLFLEKLKKINVWRKKDGNILNNSD